MTGPRAGRGLLVRRGAPRDLSGLVALERRSQPHPWTRGSLAAEFRHPPPGGILVVGHVGAPRLVAYCAFRVVADELHVRNLAVDPRFRRRHLGDLLLNLMLGMGCRSGCRRADLDVRAGNASALALYTSRGFVVVGRRGGYYSSPSEDALLLSRELNREP